MLGHWKAKGQNLYEKWDAITDQHFTGIGYRLIDDHINITEYLELFVRDSQFVFTARVPSQNEGTRIEFPCVEMGVRRLAFENEQHDFPQRLDYREGSDGTSLVVAISGTDGEGFTLNFAPATLDHPSAKNPITPSRPFPERCEGKWYGTMFMYENGLLHDSVEISLLIAPLDSLSWTWRTQYQSPSHPLVKDYVLRIQPGDAQTFLLDEGNGVQLFEYHADSSLRSVFQVEDVLLTSRYDLVEDGLIFEVTSGQMGTKTGDVTNFTVKHVQRVKLQRH